MDAGNLTSTKPTHIHQPANKAPKPESPTQKPSLMDKILHNDKSSDSDMNERPQAMDPVDREMDAAQSDGGKPSVLQKVQNYVAKDAEKAADDNIWGGEGAT